MSEEENKKAKAIMSVGFERNRLKPGDPGFEYDVRKEFAQPTEECDWDEEGEEEDSDEDEE